MIPNPVKCACKPGSRCARRFASGLTSDLEVRCTDMLASRELAGLYELAGLQELAGWHELTGLQELTGLEAGRFSVNFRTRAGVLANKQHMCKAVS